MGRRRMLAKLVRSCVIEIVAQLNISGSALKVQVLARKQWRKLECWLGRDMMGRHGLRAS